MHHKVNLFNVYQVPPKGQKLSLLTEIKKMELSSGCEKCYKCMKQKQPLAPLIYDLSKDLMSFWLLVSSLIKHIIILIL